jgi:DDE family transposase
MEHQLWEAIVALLAEFGKPRFDPRQDFTDHDIVRVWYWAVVHDRPTCWALCPAHWPPHLRRGLRLPSGGTMSKRLRSPSVVALLDALERRVTAPKEPGLFWMIDGKPLPIGGCSKDRQAGYGRSAGGKAKGYKLHALVGSDGALGGWRVAPMNTDERVMARRLVKAAPPEVQGYLVADTNYDSNPLHQVCDERGGLQPVTRRRYGPGHGTGHKKQTPGRLRSIGLTESPFPVFAEQLLQDRAEIERRFGNLVNWGGGLTCLPAWVRTHRRVRRWVQAKLVLAALKRHAQLRSCAA